MNIFTYLRFSALVLCSFLFTQSHAQEEKDYFITVWDLAGFAVTTNTTIEFQALTNGEVNYLWETIPAGQSGFGKFNAENSEVIISNLPAKTVIKLKLAPQNLKRFYFLQNFQNHFKLISVHQWGRAEWQSMENAFNTCVNLEVIATDIPNLDGVKSMHRMFNHCKGLNGPSNINEWNTESVTDMSLIFRNVYSFNQPLDKWKTQNVTSMESMFEGASAFNQQIGSWNTESVTNMNGMFFRASSFDQPIGDWNTENVIDMSNLFRAAIFNQPIGDWNTKNVTKMESMFQIAVHFNQSIGRWNTQNVINMRNMFRNAAFFDQPIGAWNTGKVTDMSSMFSGTIFFNQPIGAWNTSNVNNMSFMFHHTNSFNQPLNDWNTKNVEDMSNMFDYARDFNQPISNWNTQNLKYMSGMFAGAQRFNQPIGNWDTHNVVWMDQLFAGASSFNQPIGNWNTQRVTSMRHMFFKADSFNHPLNWNTSNVQYMEGMFREAKSFNQRLDSLALNNTTTFGQRDDSSPSFLDSCGMDCKNYSYTLIGWANNPNTPTNKEFGAAGLKFSTTAQAARDILTKPVAQGGKGWTIKGDALSTEDCGIILGQEESTSQSILSLYPNPAQDKLFLKNAPVNTAYKIIDGLGREVDGGISQNEEIAVGALPSGIYTLLHQNMHFTFVKE